MVEFYKRAVKKLNKLDDEQRRDLLISAVKEINLLETVLDSIDVGILVCNNNNQLVMANKCAQRLLPINDSEGELLWLAIDDENASVFFREILINTEKVTDKELDIVQQGEKKLLCVNVVPLVQSRRITGSLIYMEDITEKRMGEVRLRRAENLASLTTLAAGVAHEIKNPLGSISIHLQLLKKALQKNNKQQGKSTDKYFNVINEEVNRLNRIVVDFLYAVRPMVLELHEEDINELIKKMTDFIKFEMKQSNILCLLELDEKIPKILIDERYIRQALLNLLKNAQIAMPNGGVLTIATRFNNNEIVISICDTGIGISKDNLTKIFEPYFTTYESGTGLGLTQVYKIIREHQGEITVDSAPGAGTEFKITLPVPRKDMRMIEYSNTEKT